MPRTGVYSTSLAVQNRWLAASAEGIGVDWVSDLYSHEVRDVPGIPAHAKPIASLCLDYPADGSLDEPVLQREGCASDSTQRRSSTRKDEIRNG